MHGAAALQESLPENKAFSELGTFKSCEVASTIASRRITGTLTVAAGQSSLKLIEQLNNKIRDLLNTLSERELEVKAVGDEMTALRSEHASQIESLMREAHAARVQQQAEETRSKETSKKLLIAEKLVASLRGELQKAVAEINKVHSELVDERNDRDALERELRGVIDLEDIVTYSCWLGGSKAEILRRVKSALLNSGEFSSVVPHSVDQSGNAYFVCTESRVSNRP